MQMRSKTRKPGLILAFTALMTVSALATNVSPAAADFSCSSSYVCFYRNSNGDGQRWQFHDTNANIQQYGVAASSGYNRASPRACAYSYPNFINLNFSAHSGESKNFSLRIEASNRRTTYLCSDL